MNNIQKINEWKFPWNKEKSIPEFTGGEFGGEPYVKSEQEQLKDKYNELLKPYGVEISWIQKIDQEETVFHIQHIHSGKETYPYGQISIFTDVDYVVYRYEDNSGSLNQWKKRKLNSLDDAINFIIQRKKDEKELYRKSRREYTQESLKVNEFNIPFLNKKKKIVSDIPFVKSWNGYDSNVSTAEFSDAKTRLENIGYILSLPNYNVEEEFFNFNISVKGDKGNDYVIYTFNDVDYAIVKYNKIPWVENSKQTMRKKVKDFNAAIDFIWIKNQELLNKRKQIARQYNESLSVLKLEDFCKQNEEQGSGDLAACSHGTKKKKEKKQKKMKWSSKLMA